MGSRLLQETAEAWDKQRETFALGNPWEVILWNSKYWEQQGPLVMKSHSSQPKYIYL